jgi:formate hydrogenlyase subunit 3/multisubunit Na+/H+ antiporter MnhD subunit
VLIGGIGATLAGLALGNLKAALAGAVAYTLHAILTITALYLAGRADRAR